MTTAAPARIQKRFISLSREILGLRPRRERSGLKRAAGWEENPRACASASTSAARRSKAVALDEHGAHARPAARDDAPARLRRDRSTRSPPSCASSRRRPARRGTVGVGMPGAISPATGLVKNANSTWLIGQAARPRPRRAPRAAGALRERRQLLRALRGGGRRGRRGARRLRRDRGHRHRRRRRRRPPGARPARTRSRGEWGHNPLPWPRADEWPGPPCYCGKTGCVETFLSGPGMARDHRERDAASSVGAPEIAARAERGDARGHRDARPLRGPDGPRARGRPQRPRSRRRRARRRAVADRPASTRACRGSGSSGPSPTAWTRACGRPVHGDSSGVRGAAWLWGPGEE